MSGFSEFSRLAPRVTLCLLMAIWFASPLRAQPQDSICAPGQTLQGTFSSGTAWDMCYAIQPAQGVVLRNVYFTTPDGQRRRVLGDASLAQIYTEYDDGATALIMNSSSGLGNSLLTLFDSDCPGGQLHSVAGNSVICQLTRGIGYRIKLEDSQYQGEVMEVFSASRVGAKTYIVRWNFHDNGTIEPMVGLSGSLVKTSTNVNFGWRVGAANSIVSAFTNHYFWRLDFDLGSDAGNDQVEEIIAIPSSDRLLKSSQRTLLNSEAARSHDIETKRFWRIKDASQTNGSVGNISYELALLNYAHQGDGNSAFGWLSNDVYFTRYNDCERLAVNNSAPACGTDISQFVNGESLGSSDVVAWYRLSYHHLPRDEDIGRVTTRWSSFQLYPRDWFASNPLAQ